MTGSRPLVCVRPPGWIHQRDDSAFSRLGAWAEHAESLGFDGFFVGDRLLSAATAHGSSVYAASMLEATTLLAAIAARTSRMLLGPLVLVLPYRHPLQLAKILATLDLISGGRLVLGAGTGWNRPELAALGIAPRERAPRFEQSVDLMRRWWRGETVSADGPIWSLDEATLAPLPPGRIPIWIASFSPDSALDWTGDLPPQAQRVLDRVGRLGDGWVPLIYSASSKRRLDATVLAAAWDRVLVSASAAGRSRDDIDFIFSDWCFVADDAVGEERCRRALATFFTGDWRDARRTYTIGTGEEVVAAVRKHTVGIDHVDAYVLTPLSDDREQLDALAELVAPRLREGQ